MSKKESAKEEMANYRAVLVVILTSLLGVFGYAIINFEKLTNFQVIFGSIAQIMLF